MIKRTFTSIIFILCFQISVFAMNEGEERIVDLLQQFNLPVDDLLVREVMEIPEENQRRVIELVADIYTHLPQINVERDPRVIQSLFVQFRDPQRLRNAEELSGVLPAEIFLNIEPQRVESVVNFIFLHFGGLPETRQQEVINTIQHIGRNAPNNNLQANGNQRSRGNNASNILLNLVHIPFTPETFNFTRNFITTHQNLTFEQLNNLTGHIVNAQIRRAQTQTDANNIFHVILERMHPNYDRRR